MALKLIYLLVLGRYFYILLIVVTFIIINRYLFSHSPGSQKYETRVPAWRVSGEIPLPG